MIDPEIVSYFETTADVRRICGSPLDAELQGGLSNQVFRISAEQGVFFLRFPIDGSSERVDRRAEAANMKFAANLCIAPQPLHCAPERGILLTKELVDVAVPRVAFAESLGRAVGKLHGSGAEFRGRIAPIELCETYIHDLTRFPGVDDELDRLRDLSKTLAATERPLDQRLVPSHGDLSEGNCLMTADGLRLIDWEYSGMAEPAWDLAYSIIENGLTDGEEHRFLDAYVAIGAGHLLPGGRALDLAKSRCDLVSALWALDRFCCDPDDPQYLSFSRERTDRAARRLGMAL